MRVVPLRLRNTLEHSPDPVATSGYEPFPAIVQAYAGARIFPLRKVRFRIIKARKPPHFEGKRTEKMSDLNSRKDHIELEEGRQDLRESNLRWNWRKLVHTQVDPLVIHMVIMTSTKRRWPRPTLCTKFRKPAIRRIHVGD